MEKLNRLNMKKLILIALIFIGCSAYTQDNVQESDSLEIKPGNGVQLVRQVKKACKGGKYSKLEKFFVKKYKYKKYIIDGYEIFKSDDLEDYNYVYYDIKSDEDYKAIVDYALEYILNPTIKVNHEVYKKCTALCQEDNEGDYHIVFILNPNSYEN
jgi:opacity protein-like surface antigen